MATPHRVDLPGLVGDEPLAFLAAIGLVDILLSGGQLCWDPDDRHAILYTDSYASVADLVAILMKRLASVREGEAIPSAHGFPIPRRRGASDPLRMRPHEYRQIADRVRRTGAGWESWLKATLCETATDADGYCRVNPLIAVRGRQTIGSFWYYPMLEVRADPARLLTEALMGWRRVDGSEGWLLDHRATYSTDPRLRGPGGSMAVPGATWLATLAVRQFGYSRYGSSSAPIDRPSGWFQVGDAEVFGWPLWTLPASSNTMDAMWNVGWASGCWRFEQDSDRGVTATISTTHGVGAPNSIDHVVDVGIFTMCAAARSRRDGPLEPVPVRVQRTSDLWPEYPPWQGWDWEVPEVADYPGRYGWG